MSKSQLPVPAGFPNLLEEIKARIQGAQTRAIFAANAELVRLYWDIGRLIDQRQRRDGWGAAVIPRLARELRNELSEGKGFSERNIKRMLAFYREYSYPPAIVQPAVAQLPTTEEVPQPAAQLKTARKVPQPAAQLETARKVPQPAAQLEAARKVPQPAAQMSPKPILPQPAAKLEDAHLWSIPWFHHVVLMEKVKDPKARLWYMAQTLANGWSRNVLLIMIKSGAHRRQGRAITNFDQRLPAPQSDLARQTLKDPYIFDFLTLAEPFHERELETKLLRQLERFLLELGRGFAFVGRQLQLEVGGSEFYIDLLFYHLKLRCFVVVDLKKGEFKPEYAGKMNFYLSVVDDRIRHESDAPSIGLILCQDRNQIIAEYALHGVSKPIGISEYELTRALPSSLKSVLPTVEEIEAELTESATVQPNVPKARKKATKTKKPAMKKPKKKGRDK